MTGPTLKEVSLVQKDRFINLKVGIPQFFSNSVLTLLTKFCVSRGEDDDSCLGRKRKSSS